MPRERTNLRYQLYRSKARQRATFITTEHARSSGIASNEIDLSCIRFDAIDAYAIAAYGMWSEPRFTWEEISSWKAREPLSFDLSIWFGLELCGLCFANPNQSRLRLKIVRLEGKPGESHPLKGRIGTLALIGVEEYARIIGSQLIEIQEPEPGAVALYQKLGFEFDTRGRLVAVLDSN